MDKNRMNEKVKNVFSYIFSSAVFGCALSNKNKKILKEEGELSEQDLKRSFFFGFLLLLAAVFSFSLTMPEVQRFLQETESSMGIVPFSAYVHAGVGALLQILCFLPFLKIMPRIYKAALEEKEAELPGMSCLLFLSIVVSVIQTFINCLILFYEVLPVAKVIFTLLPVSIFIFLWQQERRLEVQTGMNFRENMHRAATAFLCLNSAVAVVGGLSFLYSGGSFPWFYSLLLPLIVSFPAVFFFGTAFIIAAAVDKCNGFGILLQKESVLERCGDLNCAVINTNGILLEDEIELKEMRTFYEEDAVKKGSNVFESKQMPADGKLDSSSKAFSSSQSKMLMIAAAILGKADAADLSEFEKSIVSAVEAENLPEVKRFRQHDGCYAARCFHENIRIGGRAYVGLWVEADPEVDTKVTEIQKQAEARGETLLYMSLNRRLCAVFVFGRKRKDNAEELLSSLKNSGYKLVLLSEKDDRQAAFQAEQLAGKENVMQGLDSGEKAALICTLRLAGHKTAFVTDSADDVLAVEAAELSVIPGSGADCLWEKSDAVLLNNSTDKLVDFFLLGALVGKAVRQLRNAALGMDILLLFAASGLLSLAGVPSYISLLIILLSFILLIYVDFQAKKFSKCNK